MRTLRRTARSCFRDHGRSRSRRRRYHTRGGRAIASGGFGCVFYPALRCAKNRTRRTGVVSKLMSDRHADSEYRDILRVRKWLRTIPHFGRYFLIGKPDKCKPAPLTDNDLQTFEKCRTFRDDGITQENVNTHLRNMSIVTIRHGGVPVDEFLQKVMPSNGNSNGKGSTRARFATVNQALMQLLQHGIVPMNKRHVFHCDIKDSNIVVDSEHHARLIDWGLVCRFPASAKELPHAWRNRPFQFNTPFSVILFSDMFRRDYHQWLLRHAPNHAPAAAAALTSTTDAEGEAADGLDRFLWEFIVAYMEMRGPGHYYAINRWMDMLYQQEPSHVGGSFPDNMPLLERHITLPILCDYLKPIVRQFTRHQQFQHMAFAHDLFARQTDLWGLCSAYLPMLTAFVPHLSSMNPEERRLYQKVRALHLHLFQNSTTPLSSDHILAQLRAIQQDLVRLPNQSILFRGGGGGGGH